MKMVGTIFVLFVYISLSQCAPIAKNMVDMTHVLDETTLILPIMKKFELKATHNGMTEGGFWLKVEDYSSAIHVGTHMDAPSHFAKDGLPIDKISIDKFIAPGAVIDITTKAELDPDAEATVEDLIRWETITGHSLNGTIVLLKSGWGLKWSNASAYFGSAEGDPTQLHSPGLSLEAAKWLVANRKILGVGVDTISLDKGSSQNFEAHQVILEQAGLFIIENIANMEELPTSGATIYVFPMKIGNSGGAPVRMIAIFPEVTDYTTRPEKEL